MVADHDMAGVYSTVVCKVVREEVATGKGEETLFQLIEAEQLIQSPDDPVPGEFYDRDYLSTVIGSVATEFMDCWQSDEFLKVLQQNPSGLLINIETGDFSELINATYPWSESLNFDYTQLTTLEGRTCFMLDDFLEPCTGKTFNEADYFEFADLTSHNFAESYEGWHDVELGFETKRALLASIAMVAAVRSLKGLATHPERPKHLWVSTSEGCMLIAALTRIP